MKQVKVIFITCEIAALLGLVITAYASCDFTVASVISVLSIWAVTCQKEHQDIEWEDYVESV